MLMTMRTVTGPSMTLDPAKAGAVFAGADELRRDAFGMPVAVRDDGAWLLPMDEHQLTLGRTGAGKTVSAALPQAALAARNTDCDLVIIDAKDTLRAELEPVCVAAGMQVRVIDLRDPRRDTYNLLEEPAVALRAGDARRAEALLASTFEPLATSVRDDDDPIWSMYAEKLLTETFRALVEAFPDKTPTMTTVVEVAVSIDALNQLMSKCSKDTQKRLSAVMRIGKADSTWGGIVFTAEAACAFFTGAVGRAVGAASSFDVREDFCGLERTALFLVCPDEADDADAFASQMLNRVYVDRVSAYETAGAEGRTALRDVHVFMDEAGRFPRSCIRELLSTGPSRGIYLHLFMQSSSQLSEVAYTEKEAAVMLEQVRTTVVMQGTDEYADRLVARMTGMDEGRSLCNCLGVGDALVVRAGRPVLRTHLAAYA